MSEPDKASTNEAAAEFGSIANLRAAHNQLLERRRASGDTPDLLAAVEGFLRRGQVAGALLDSTNDRRAAQSMLDYWANALYRLGVEPPDTTLAPFDPTRAPTLDDSKCPYVGLDPFRESTHGLFYGRERLVDELVRHLTTHRMTIVVGPSGSGKSSLVQAGLIPALKSGALPGSQTWRYFPPIVPGADPLANLALLVVGKQGATGVAAGVEADQAEPDSTIAVPSAMQQATRDLDQVFREHPQHLAKLLGEAPVLVVVDQFEEIFTLCDDDQARQAFVANLLGLIQAPDSPHTLILTMRSDFESYFARLPVLQAQLEQNQFRMTALSASELRATIEKPADRIGLKFEDGIIDALLSDILGEPAALPLLQVTLLRLWENRERNRITWQAYQRLGGARQALARSADAFYEGLLPEEQTTMKRILLRLVRPGEGLEITSSRIRRATLYQSSEAHDRIDRVLEKLVDTRLVRLTSGATPADDQIEIAHEALVRNWPRLVAWLDDERATLRRRLHLAATAEQWRERGEDPGLLLRGVLLEDALRYEDLNDLEAAFVRASLAASRAEQQAEIARQVELVEARARAEAERRRAEYQAQARRRLLMLAVVLAIVSLFALGTAVFAIAQRQQAQREYIARATEIVVRQTAEASAKQNEQLANAREAQAVAARATAEADRTRAERESRNARANELAARAKAVSEAFPQRGLLLAIAAIHATQDASEAPVRAAEQALWDGLSTTGGWGLSGNSGPIIALAISPDGRYLVSAGQDGTMLVWDIAAAPSARVTPTALRGHSGSVRALAISPDGRYLVSAGQDGMVLSWNLAALSTAPTALLPMPVTQIMVIAFDPNGRWLAAGLDDGSIWLWTVPQSGLPTAPQELKGHGSSVNALAFSPDGRWLVTGSRDFTLRRWDLSTPTAPPTSVELAGHSLAVTDLVFTPNGRWLLSASVDGTVRRWEIAASDPAASGIVVGKHDEPILGLAISPDGLLVASASTDTSARLWAVEQPDPNHPRQVLLDHSRAVTNLIFSPDGRWLLTASEDHTIRRWDLAAQKPAALVLHGHEGAVGILRITADGRLLASGSDDGTVRIWDLRAPTPAMPLALPNFTGFVSAMAASTDGNMIAAGGSDPANQALRLWRLGDSGPAEPLILPGHMDYIAALTFSPDRRWLASGSYDGTARLWDLHASNPSVAPMLLEGHQGPVSDVSISSDSRLLATACEDGHVRLYDLATPRPTPTRTLGGSNGSVGHVALDPTGRWLAASADTVLLWALASNNSAPLALPGPGPAIQALAFSLDGRWLAAGDSNGTIRLWDLHVSDLAAAARDLTPHRNGVTSVAFSSDSRLLAIAGRDGAIQLYDLAGSAPLTPRLLRGHQGDVTALAFDTAGRHLISGGADTTARLWDVGVDAEHGVPLVLRAHQARLSAVALLPGGHWALTGGADGLRLWNLHADELLALACRTAGREPSGDERAEYFAQQKQVALCGDLVQ